MDRTRRLVTLLLLVLLVPASSLLGLLRPMQELGGRVFVEVWSANVWGDLVFTLGTLGAGLATGWIVLWFWRHENTDLRPLAALAIPASLLLHWTVYALSWSWTGPAMDSGGAFWSWTFVWDGFTESWRWTWEWGWPGLVVLAFLGPLPAWLAALSWTERPAGGTQEEPL